MIGSAGPKLIGAGMSRAFRCLWVLEELGIPYRYVAALPQSAEVKQHNPLGKIPVLVEDDGFCLYETNAIIGYLGDKHGSSDGSSSHLVPPAGTKERGLYEQAMSVLATELDAQGLWIHRKHEAMGEHFGHIPDAVEHARKYFNKTNRMLIQQLKDNTATVAVGSGKPSYLLGPDFTAADIVYVHCLDWSKAIGWDAKWKDDATITKYIKVCKSRDSFSRTLAVIKQAKKKRANSRSNI